MQGTLFDFTCSFLYDIIEPSLLGAPFRRDSSSSEFDEVKRRFLIVNPSQDLRYQGSSEPPLLSRSPASPIEPQGGWLIEEDMNRVQLNNRKSGTVQESGALKTDKHRARQNVRFHGTLGSASVRLPSQVSEVWGEEVCAISFSFKCLLGYELASFKFQQKNVHDLQGYPDREQQRHNPPSAIPLSGMHICHLVQWWHVANCFHGRIACSFLCSVIKTIRFPIGIVSVDLIHQAMDTYIWGVCVVVYRYILVLYLTPFCFSIASSFHCPSSVLCDA